MASVQGRDSRVWCRGRDQRSCKPVGVITPLLRLLRRRSWVGSRNSGYGRRPRTCRSARQCARHQRAITDPDLAEQTAAIGTLQGRVRGVHLAAHIAMRHILTPEQVTRYDELRGYAGDPTTSAPAQHGHGSRAH